MPEGTDRYNSDPGDFGRSLEERFRGLEQKIEESLRRNPLRDASMTDGALRILDGSGNQQVVVGKQSDNSYGIWAYDDTGRVVLKVDDVGMRVYDAAGVLRARVGYLSVASGYGISVWDEVPGLRFEVNDDGYKDPWLSHPWRKVITPDRESTTSTTFVSMWKSRVELLTHKGVACTAAWVTDVGTTGEVRLKHSTGQTSAVSLAAGSSGTQQFQWLHGLALGGGPIDFEIQARVTGGAGSVHLDEPFGGCEMADPGECDADGIP